MNTGSKVLLFYLIITYGAQSILAFLFTDYYYQDYKGYDSDLVWKTLFLLTVGALIFFGQSLFNRRFEAGRNKKTTSPVIRSVAHRTRLVLATIFLALSIPFGIEYGFSFFHSGLYISDLPMWVIVLQGMKSVARLDLAYCTIKVLRRERLSNADIYCTLIYTLGGAISLAGAIDIVFLALGLLIMIGRGALVAQAFAAIESTTKKSVRWIVYGLLIASLPGAAVIGFANKIGFERTFDIISDEGQVRDAFIVPLALRVSSSHGSFIANAELPLSLDEQVESLAYPVRNMIWRGCILFVNAGCPYREDITHIARLNYVRTFWDQSPLKAGATPGLLASALYIPFLPLSIMILSLYCSMFTGLIDRAIGYKKLPLPGTMTLVLFTYPVFENPVDTLVIFDPAVAYNVGLFLILRMIRPAAEMAKVTQKRDSGSGSSASGREFRHARLPIRG